MAYLPDFRNEIFISYVHSPEEVQFRDSDDQGWTQLFARYLTAKINSRLVVRGDEASVRIWTDTSLQGNRKLESALRSEVTESALFLPIMSPFYLSSDWCLQEAAWFIEAMPNISALEQRSFIVKQYPTEESQWPEAFSELKGYEFFKQVQRNRARPLGSPLPNPRAEKHLDFFEILDLLADDVADILQDPERRCGRRAGGRNDRAPRPCRRGDARASRRRRRARGLSGARHGGRGGSLR